MKILSNDKNVVSDRNDQKKKKKRKFTWNRMVSEGLFIIRAKKFTVYEFNTHYKYADSNGIIKKKTKTRNIFNKYVRVKRYFFRLRIYFKRGYSGVSDYHITHCLVE